ncbi:MAG: hypothetical protein A2Z24_02460 [Candidatus Woykebacteria bacterium RBG_16_44_10]|uniref:Glycerophosphoryl diester phosphodiesterase membrane domain-containing protein n=1 Tax=Candidatus Woykebacteria bacterium RBG_16_44_10 TaxID=1802597 RepID=A0A1G1WFD5_9BACT|nr:MAG: hypothetical protein A2Z24_02460 [Candidatus Woykebacteria bacterium RBG_16_44_10]
MDFSALIKKSFDTAWHNRVLWLFGFLSGGTGATVVNPGGGSGFNFQIPSSWEKPADKVSQVLGITDSPTGNIDYNTILLIILIVVLVVLILVLIGIFISNWASAALVYSILYRNKARPTFGVGARAGLKYWWKFWLLTAVLGMFILVFVLMLAIPGLLLFLAKMTPLLVVYAIIAVLIFIIAMFVIAVVGSLIISIAQRMIIHRGIGVLDSIKLSGGLIKKYLGESILTYVVAIGLNIGAGFVALIAMLPMGIILFIVFIATMAAGGVWAALVAAVVVGIPILILLFTAGGFWSAFNATYWTLFYEHLASKEGW